MLNTAVYRLNRVHQLSIGQRSIEYVDNFPYLGIYISRIGDAEVDTRVRRGKAASIFQRLRQIWTSNTVNTITKLHLYKLLTTVIQVAIYAADTWKGMTRISHMLDVFHRRRLRTILGISWQDHITNDELMRRAGMEDLSNIVRVRRLTPRLP